MYDAVELSKYIVTKCVNEDCPISNLQLQKILYYIQKGFLKRADGKAAFIDEIEAWQFGPVVPSVYYYFCGFGAMPISRKYMDCGIEESEDKNLIDSIVITKRKLNPWEMVAETHKENGAWDMTYQNGKGNHKVISVDLIRCED